MRISYKFPVNVYVIDVFKGDNLYDFLLNNSLKAIFKNEKSISEIYKYINNNTRKGYYINKDSTIYNIDSNNFSQNLPLKKEDLYMLLAKEKIDFYRIVFRIKNKKNYNDLLKRIEEKFIDISNELYTESFYREHLNRCINDLKNIVNK